MKYIVFFSNGRKDQKELLGGKGASLAAMSQLKLPVPPGFTITTKACLAYMQSGMPKDLAKEVRRSVQRLEKLTGKELGSRKNPLLVSVRSGAAVSMPGMMDTVLNLGLNQETVEGLAELTGNPRFAYDSLRRFVMMFADIVFKVKREEFEALLAAQKKVEGVSLDPEVSAEGMKEVALQSIDLFRRRVGRFYEDPYAQLEEAIRAVFDSWKNPRAITYRNIHKIPHTLGTAVNVQCMVFGNMGEDSGTGVVFTRNPTNGKRVLYGEYLANAQGEDVVAGVRTPLGIADLRRRHPSIYRELKRICAVLEDTYRDMMDVEFTVERGKLYMLQCRVGKRTAEAAVRIATDMVKEKRISVKEALLRVDPDQAGTLLHGTFQNLSQKALARGLPASPGAASGVVVFTADEAARLGRETAVILVRPETTPDDIHGMAVAKGIFTARGGMTSHAAVVARGMGKPCVAGCESLVFNVEKGVASIGSVELKEGDTLSLNGTTGEVFLGALDVSKPKLSAQFRTILKWADRERKLRVRTNADTPEDARRAREFGAEGIGLCRTEHMFLGRERLPWVQKMIMAQTQGERQEALAKLEKMQIQDFEGIFQAMAGLPVTIRLLDPPLHEFLPSYEEQLLKVRELELKGSPECASEREILLRIEALREANPMLGLRGVRLGLLFPEIYTMQARAIFTAACHIVKRGKKVHPEIMIPLVGTVEEIRRCKEVLEQSAQKVLAQEKKSVPYTFGTMIELPRAALVADTIAEHAQFFSFGTNDLTQTTFGYSRDDAEGKFLFYYLDQGILKENPFERLDSKGVGELMAIAVEKGKRVRKNLKVGICGEHGGDPSSIAFCHQLGLDYVSCSPFRVPIARLAAAQIALQERRAKSKRKRLG